MIDKKGDWRSIPKSDSTLEGVEAYDDDYWITRGPELAPKTLGCE